MARVDVGISIGVPGVIIGGPGYYAPPPPVYVAPPPVVYAPAPVVVVPRHRYYEPVRVYGPRYYREGFREYHGPRRDWRRDHHHR